MWKTERATHIQVSLHFQSAAVKPQPAEPRWLETRWWWRVCVCVCSKYLNQCVMEYKSVSSCVSGTRAIMLRVCTVCFAEYSTYLRLCMYCLCLRGYFCTQPSNCTRHAPLYSFPSSHSLCPSTDWLRWLFAVGEKPPAETGTKSPDSTVSLCCILHLKA